MNLDIRNNKNTLRKSALASRASIDDDTRNRADKIIFNRVISNDSYTSANTILLYVSYNNEVDTIKLINYSLSIGKRVALPVSYVEADVSLMDFYYIDNLDSLVNGYKDIKEPPKLNNNLVSQFDENTLMIMPLVAYDNKRNRIGYGKGFYDRFLYDHKTIKTIALAYSVQEVSNIPDCTHDIKPHMIITEGNIL